MISLHLPNACEGTGTERKAAACGAPSLEEEELPLSSRLSGPSQSSEMLLPLEGGAAGAPKPHLLPSPLLFQRTSFQTNFTFLGGCSENVTKTLVCLFRKTKCTSLKNVARSSRISILLLRCTHRHQLKPWLSWVADFQGV